jgi:hypothetical protein
MTMRSRSSHLLVLSKTATVAAGSELAGVECGEIQDHVVVRELSGRLGPDADG